MAVGLACPSRPSHIFSNSSPVAKVSVGHIKTHKSLVCRRALNHQSEVVCKSDFKWACDYLGTRGDAEVAKRVWDKAAASEIKCYYWVFLDSLKENWTEINICFRSHLRVKRLPEWKGLQLKTSCNPNFLLDPPPSQTACPSPPHRPSS